MPSPTRQQILTLYKNCLKYANQVKFTDKDWLKQRIRQEFSTAKTENIDFSYKKDTMLSALSTTVRYLNLSTSRQAKKIRSKQYIDRTQLPTLSENDLQENIISGSGPGGQSVNKAVNCCQIKHVPTGIIVKCHTHRTLQKNRELARKIMIGKLDDFYNGEASVSAQRKKLDLEQATKKAEKRRELRAMKDEYKSSLKSQQGLREMVNKKSDTNDL